MLPLELPIELWFAVLTFIANSAFLTLYFSNVLSVPGSKHAPRRDAFFLSLLGSAVGAAFSLFIPMLPDLLPYMDVAVALVIVTWVLLLHFWYDTGWAEAVVGAVLAAIIYVVVLAITVGFLILWVKI